MNEFRVEAIDDKIVLYYGTKEKSISAYTLASTLISFADAARKANALINPGYEIEVIVETLSDGSFKAVLRTVYRSVHNLFSAEALKAIIFGVISTAIYELAFKSDPVIIINTTEVIIEKGGNKLIVPRVVYDTTKKLESSVEFKKSVYEVIDTVQKDKTVESFGLSSSETEPPPINLPSSSYSVNLDDINAPPNEADQKIVSENAHLEILKAILDRSNRKWEFVWQGFKISAPVTDETFYDKFFRHEIKIAPGDALEANIRITQRRLDEAGVYENVNYEIVKVIKHEPKIKPTSLSF